MLNVVMLSVVMLNVVAPKHRDIFVQRIHVSLFFVKLTPGANVVKLFTSVIY